MKSLYHTNDECVDFTCMRAHFGDDMDLLCRQRCYPYELFDSVHTFDHDGLPPAEPFESQSSQKRNIRDRLGSC